MTPEKARLKLVPPLRFGDDEQIEAVHILELLETVVSLHKQIREDCEIPNCSECKNTGMVECDKCYGTGECSHCGGECGQCDGEGEYECESCGGAGAGIPTIEKLEGMEPYSLNRILDRLRVAAKSEGVMVA